MTSHTMHSDTWPGGINGFMPVKKQDKLYSINSRCQVIFFKYILVLYSLPKMKYLLKHENIFLIFHLSSCIDGSSQTNIL